MTSTIAGRLSTSLGLAKENHLVDYGLRAVSTDQSHATTLTYSTLSCTRVIKYP